MHYMYNRMGGLKEDVPAGWTGRARTAVAGVRPVLAGLKLSIDAVPRGIGVLSPRDVLSYGVSGPVARASGVMARFTTTGMSITTRKCFSTATTAPQRATSTPTRNTVDPVAVTVLATTT